MAKSKALFYFLTCLLQGTTFATTSADRLCIVEKKMDVLEPLGMRLLPADDHSIETKITRLKLRMDRLETRCVARAAKKRFCLPPKVVNGWAQCPEDLPPGTKCSVRCNTGYIATPGKDVAICMKDGFWNNDLDCEIPLVVLSGGIVGETNSGDDSVEVVSLYPSSGCNITIPNMPKADGSHRTLHNLMYMPNKKILACNGMTNPHKTGRNERYRASCDEWSFKTKKWTRHSYPNEGMTESDISCQAWTQTTCLSPEEEKGRYAAEMINRGGIVYLFGGMVYDKDGHTPTKTSRSLYESDTVGIRHHWNKENDLQESRAFFCLLEVNDGVLAIGGLSKDSSGPLVLKSIEFSSFSSSTFTKKKSKKFSEMTSPRSGHSCTSLPVGNFSILVSGGTEGFGQAAVATTEMFSLSENTWTPVADMNFARFGHAVVAVGSRIFAIGGDDRNSNNFDTIEEFDINEKKWQIIPKKLKMSRSNFGHTLIPHSMFDGCQIEKPLTE